MFRKVTNFILDWLGAILCGTFIAMGMLVFVGLISAASGVEGAYFYVKFNEESREFCIGACERINKDGR